MWETIEHVLTSPSLIPLLIFILIVITVAIVLSKNGLLHITTKNVQMGAADNERDIIRQQIEWVSLHYKAMENNLDKPEGYDKWRGRYITELVIDEFVSMIAFNHISKSQSYIEVKQEKILSVVMANVVRDEFKSDEFINMLKDDVQHVIEKLVQIRELYHR